MEFGKMRAELVRIGNSRGIRIPKPIIEQCHFGDSVELRVENDCLVIASRRVPRQGWEEAFRAAGPAEEDELLLDSLPPNEFDFEDWRW
jgi:antitoxin MazE